jgi:hypothetical protein
MVATHFEIQQKSSSSCFPLTVMYLNIYVQTYILYCSIKIHSVTSDFSLLTTKKLIVRGTFCELRYYIERHVAGLSPISPLDSQERRTRFRLLMDDSFKIFFCSVVKQSST